MEKRRTSNPVQHAANEVVGRYPSVIVYVCNLSAQKTNPVGSVPRARQSYLPACSTTSTCKYVLGRIRLLIFSTGVGWACRGVIYVNMFGEPSPVQLLLSHGVHLTTFVQSCRCQFGHGAEYTQQMVIICRMD